MFVLICPTIFEIQGFEISRKHPPPLILRKHCHDCCVLSRANYIHSNNNNNNKRKKKTTTLFDPSQDVLETVASDKVFSKTDFSIYLKNRFRYRKNVWNQICRSINFQLFTFLAHFDISNRF